MNFAARTVVALHFRLPPFSCARTFIHFSLFALRGVKPFFIRLFLASRHGRLILCRTWEKPKCHAEENSSPAYEEVAACLYFRCAEGTGFTRRGLRQRKFELPRLALVYFPPTFSPFESSAAFFLSSRLCLPLPAPRRLFCEVVAFHSLPAKRAGLWPPVKSSMQCY